MAGFWDSRAQTWCGSRTHTRPLRPIRARIIGPDGMPMEELACGHHQPIRVQADDPPGYLQQVQQRRCTQCGLEEPTLPCQECGMPLPERQAVTKYGERVCRRCARWLFRVATGRR